MTVACGVDGCMAGWVVVWHDLENERMRWEVMPRLEDIAGATPRPAVIGIDVPIGLLESGARECDLLARSRLGFPRSSSVFPAPVRPVLAASNHAEASAIRKAVEGKGMSVQAWGIVPKVREADEAMRADAHLRGLVREVHPELSFAGMSGGRPMTHSKKSAAGRAERVAVLRDEFGAFIDEALASRPRGCAVDDLLDAFACTWTAARVVHGESEVIPADPPRDAYGLPMEMVI
jgi:predicted RNase H-like nuclease